MGRLIDVDELDIALLIGELYGNKTAIQVIDEAPIVEAIPKDQYEARLKVDLEAILVDLKLEIEECVDGAEGSPQFEQGVTIARVQVVEMIQQKINVLKAESEDDV